jgi:hypothetical protein
VSEVVVAIAIKAQHRLYKKFRKLDKQKHRQKPCVKEWILLRLLPSVGNKRSAGGPLTVDSLSWW